VAAVLTSVGLTGPVAAQSLSAPEMKAAYLFNFAQFVEWPAEVSAGAPLAMCIVNDGAVAEALERTVKGRALAGRDLVVKRIAGGGQLPPCHLLYVAGPDLRASLGVIEPVKGTFVFTVSDAVRSLASTGR